jgi:hypothetical protein
MEYNILSPDGISINMDNFKSKAKANKAFTLWRKRFELQGYYSSSYGRIALTELKHTCQMITIKDDDVIDCYYL